MASKLAFGLGLAQRAGKAVSGDFAVKESLKGGKAKLLILATDIAPNTKKELLFLAEEAGIPVMEGEAKAELGEAIGKAPRASVAITDSNFVRLLTGK